VLTYPTILLDLDGTMVDSAPGVVSTLAKTLEQMGEPVPEMEELLRWVGPPLPESFQKRAGFGPQKAREAIDIFRSQYVDSGVFDSRVFDGMGEFLLHAKNAGAHLAVATSKPTTSATIMLRHFLLSRYFDVIACAADDETRGAKHEVIEDALQGLRDKGLPTDNVIMVGDRIHDVEGAKFHGIDTVLVRWGYGGPAEWELAHRLVDTPRQLHAALGVPGGHR
jgi:phosphoglycolate phosphatase